jgi:SAM-dependent methyltransferase
MSDGCAPYLLALAKHLPPSASVLRLLDLDGTAGAALAGLRADLEITPLALADLAVSSLPADSLDAAAGCGRPPADDDLRLLLRALRPGGRLIVVDPDGAPTAGWVACLEDAGYGRILVEPALADGSGVLLRGEKPHTEQRTVDRIRQVAGQDAVTDLAAYRGRYVHLLVRQTPSKPAWALRPDEAIDWQVVALAAQPQPVLLAFSSLPRAVALMQPAVMAGLIVDVNRVAKFSRDTVAGWGLPLLFNPTMDALAGQSITLLPVDPASAEAPDE